MNPAFEDLMAQAHRLTRAGDLQAATAAIQRALARGAPQPPADAYDSDIIDVDAEVIDIAAPEAAIDEARPVDRVEPHRPPRGPADDAGITIAGHHADRQGGRDYKLFVPPQAATSRQPLPLVLMLHGCTQNADDFAQGTAMNDAARERGFYVLYPEQSAQANPQRCWNWFKHSHQQRGRGEPALIVGMLRALMAAHPVDSSRVYVAGLSAGGAMAAILGHTHPELFAAVGVHSGLAAGAATDLPAALSAMRQGGAGKRAEAAVPTIVFHGDADVTVHPSNGDHVVAAARGAGTATSSQRVQAQGRRASTRHIHRGSDGRVLAEHWIVHGSAHAWSGGSREGSYTDPAGPDATAEMLRFFFDHGK